MYLQGSHGEVSYESHSEIEESEGEEVTTAPPGSYTGLDDYGDQSNVSNDNNCDNDESLDVLTRKFLCKIRGENRLTGKAVQNIAVATGHFMKQMLANVERNVGDILQNADIGNEEDLENIARVFDDTAKKVELLRTPLSETFSNRSSYCGLHKIEPVKHVFGNIVRRGKKMRIVEVEDTFYYISVLKTIQVQLGCSKLLDIVLAGPKKSANHSILEDFSDGTFFQNHELFSNNDSALLLLLYYDDVNFINPLTNKNHKLSFFYYQIANLPPEYRSALKSIHLFAVYKTEHLSNPKYGFNKVMGPLVEEMKMLGSDRGYTFSLPIGHINLRGGIFAVLADTPASNKAGGFKEGVGGARRKCRHCMANFEDMQCLFMEEDFQLWNMDSHLHQLLRIENAASEYLRGFYCNITELM
ncbi:hypothetical protein P5673_026746 [Acropora cervicornis]|uniref:Uncharacterized protein n=1 Tax=Acropora cervicornis TaxID=6130 RepID=A0AAD9Q051_ACRCE|nr:hypothetical protein P5673_026746 [Acropora cervicornis]